MASKVLIIGCGYIGRPLALRLKARGGDVTGWVHSTSSAEALMKQKLARVIVGSVGDERIWKGMKDDYDVVVQCASSGRGGAEAYQEVYLRGAVNVNRYLPIARQIFVSSTAVYGQTGGEWVREESPAEPGTETGKILRLAEKTALLGHGMVVRSSGIYGPGRKISLEKLRRGEAVIEGDGTRWMNRIHQSDLVSALEHLIGKGDIGQIYNATDDVPVTENEFYLWCSEFLQKPIPPHGPVNRERKRGVTSKRVSNAKLRATGWRPVYPSFREGLAEAV
ncbi:MAG: NAD-dependent epimerase/dehydratase family protein [Methylacidiphilales bacterium]|nr:NAD-dependent epimerase/dehydratase family protein [Candidatus Methylacidiphilales bacterium]